MTTPTATASATAGITLSDVLAGTPGSGPTGSHSSIRNGDAPFRKWTIG